MPATTATKNFLPDFDWDALGVDLVPVDDGRWDIGCECEIDWTCPACGSGPSFLETRYQGMDADEARYFGRYEDV